LSVSFTQREDETALKTNIAAAAPHYLESWNDHVLTKGMYSLTQPTIRPLFNTKQFQEALMSWNGVSGNYYDYLRAGAAGFLGNTSWNQALHDGLAIYSGAALAGGTADYTAAANALSSSKSKGLELVLYTKTGIGDGQQANNPWLQEFPDPITRVSWDNYVTISQADAKEWKLENNLVANGGLNGSYASLTLDGVKLDNVPVIPPQIVPTVGDIST
jgi:molybdopterin-containing oxidoreductase family iron-sulfur binding subunit